MPSTFYSRDPDRRTRQDLDLLQTAFGLSGGHETVLCQLLDDARLVQCSEGPLALATPRRPEPSWWLVRQGRVSLGVHRADGSFAERCLAGPGHWLDVAGALSADGSWLESAQCQSQVELLALPLSTLVPLCAQDAGLAMAYGAVLARALRQLHDQFVDLVSTDATTRAARWLWRLAQAAATAEDGSVLLTLHERKSTVAQRLNLTSETLSRCLAELRKTGVVQVKGYAVTVLDIPRLRQLAHPEPARRRYRRAGMA